MDIAPTTQDVARFCPQCCSPSVVFSTLAGGDANCTICKWMGRVEQLVAYTFQHDHGSSEAVIQAFMADTLRIFSGAHGLPLARLLAKWGFIDRYKPDPKTLGRYIEAAARAAAASMLRVRQTIESEAHEHG